MPPCIQMGSWEKHQYRLIWRQACLLWGVLGDNGKPASHLAKPSHVAWRFIPMNLTCIICSKYNFWCGFTDKTVQLGDPECWCVVEVSRCKGHGIVHLLDSTPRYQIRSTLNIYIKGNREKEPFSSNASLEMICFQLAMIYPITFQQDHKMSHFSALALKVSELLQIMKNWLYQFNR